MNLQIELKKSWDWINLQPTVVRLILIFAVLIFVVIPFTIPVGIGYFLWNFVKTKNRN